MRAWYRLFNHEIVSMIRAAGLIGIGMVVFPFLLVRFRIVQEVNLSQTSRFEDLYADAGGTLVFGVGLAAMLAFFLARVYGHYGHYGKTKSIDTLLALPVRREAIYFARIGAFAVCLLLVWAAELIGVQGCYAYAAAQPTATDDGRFATANGLFLAFVRSPFLRLILPQSPIGWLSTWSLLLVLLTGVYYGALCERSRRYWGFIPLGVAAAWMIRALTMRLDDPASAPAVSEMAVDSAALIAFSAFFMWHSLQLIKKGAVA
jgi:hypothetical protein